MTLIPTAQWILRSMTRSIIKNSILIFPPKSVVSSFYIENLSKTWQKHENIAFFIISPVILWSRLLCSWQQFFSFSVSSLLAIFAHHTKYNMHFYMYDMFMCFFHHQCSHNGTSTGLYLRPLNVPFCLSSNVFEVGNWHHQIGTFSPQEIEFNSSMTTNDNGRDDKIVVKITTKMGQLYNSISVTDSLFFSSLFISLTHSINKTGWNQSKGHNW